MNGQTLTWSQDELYTELVSVRNQVDKLINKVLSLKPTKYGSDAWWKESDKKALESIKAGKGKKFDTYEDAVHYLNS